MIAAGLVLLICPFRKPLCRCKREEVFRYILAILPPNFALRLTVMAAAVTCMFALAYLRWYLIDRRAKQRMAASVS